MRSDPAYATLMAVLDTGSFDLAAARLSVTQSAVSQRIKSLEDRLGTALVIRAQPCTPTEAGRHVLRHAEAVQLLDASLTQRLNLHDANTAVAPTLRVAVNADSVDTWFLDALAACPAPMLYDLVLHDQDHSDALLRQADVSAAITARARPVQGCDVQPLGSLRYIPTAAPNFAQRYFFDGLTAATLARAPVLTFSRNDTLQLDWAIAQAGQRLHLNSHYLPSTAGFVTATALGMGWALNPEDLVADHLQNGTLVQIGPAHDTPLYWQVSRIIKSGIQPLTRAIMATAKTRLHPVTD
jgi:LysR family transcriptional regulator (chromosome initiation inhibitor)